MTPEERKDRVAYNQQQVMRLLRWDEETYCTFKYESGLTYLRHYTREDADAISWLETHRLFWNWWKNHWNMRDEDFLQLSWKVPDFKQEHLYRQMHNPGMLAREITPNGRILGDSYAQMIGSANRAIVTENVPKQRV